MLKDTIKVLRRTLAIVVVVGAAAHLVICQPAAVPVRFFAADLITTILAVGGYIKRSLSETGAQHALARSQHAGQLAAD